MSKLKRNCNTSHGRPRNSTRLVFIIDFFSSVVQISLAYVTMNLLCPCAIQNLYVMSAVINYFVVLISVFNFTSLFVFCPQHYQCLLHKWQLSMTLQKLSAQHWKTVTMYSVTQRSCDQTVPSLSTCLLTVRLISCSKQVTLLANCRYLVVSSFLGVSLPLGC